MFWRTLSDIALTQCSGLSCDRIIVEYTCGEHWNTLPVSVTVKLLLTHGFKYCLNGGRYRGDKVFSTTGVAPPRLRPGTCGCQMPTKHTATSQPECHNCSCGTIAIERFTRYHMIIGNIPIDSLQSTSWLSIAFKPLPVECTYISSWSFSADVPCRKDVS